MLRRTSPAPGTANAQTCNYVYDDLARIATANCGSVWSQSFTFDPFGNLSKSGTISFQPTYNASTNRVSQVGSVTPSYDANGNLTNDGVQTYGWDSDGNSISAGSATLLAGSRFSAARLQLTPLRT